MPTKKNQVKKEMPPTPTSAKRTFTFSIPKNIPLPKSWTPILMALVIIAAFVIGMLLTKVQYLEGQNGTTPGTQQAVAGTTQPSTAPSAPVNVGIGNLPVMGNANAKVKVIEFADFQCPFCEQWFKTVEPSFIKDYVDTGKVAFYWRDYPFLGQESTDAANAARCANAQGKFWQFHDYLYNHQGQENSGAFSKTNLEQFASDMGLNTSDFNSCMDNNTYAKDAAADLADGQKAGVNGTPTVFINGVPVVGAQPYSAFQQAINQALSK